MEAWGGAASGLLAQAPTPFSLTHSHHPASPKAEVSRGERGSDRRWGGGAGLSGRLVPRVRVGDQGLHWEASEVPGT